MEECITVTVEVRGIELDLDVYATLTSGGSSSFGSDEPPWFDVEITDIRGVGHKKSISDRLWDKVMGLYQDNIVGQFENVWR